MTHVSPQKVSETFPNGITQYLSETLINKHCQICINECQIFKKMIQQLMLLQEILSVILEQWTKYLHGV